MRSFFRAAIVLVTTVVVGTAGQNGVIAPGDTFPGFVKRSGFPVEQHAVVTADGFAYGNFETLSSFPPHFFLNSPPHDRVKLLIARA